MSSDSANRPQSETTSAAIHDVPEQARLDDAMRRADELLVSSLKTDERRRRRRKLILFLTTGFVVLAAIVYGGIRTAIELQKPGPPTPEQEKAAQLVKDGWEKMNEDNAKASAQFEEALKLDPSNAKAWDGLGWIRMTSDDFNAAEEAFRKALQINPKYAGALAGMGALYAEQQKYDEAEKYYLLAQPQSHSTIIQLVFLYWRLGDFDEAKKWADKLPKTQSSSRIWAEAHAAAKFKSWDVLGFDRFRIEASRFSIPQSASKQAKSAWQMLISGGYRNARQSFQQILASNPQDVDALTGLGWSSILSTEESNGLRDGQSMDRTRQTFEQALAIDPENSIAKEGIARIDKDQGDRDGAMEIWEQLLKKYPDNQRVLSELSDAYFADGNYAKALPLLERLAKLRPRDQRVKGFLDTARRSAN